MKPKVLRQAEKHLKEADRYLHKIIKKAGPCSIKVNRTATPYEALARSIIYQQLAGRAAEAIYKKFLALFGNKMPPPKILSRASVAKLRKAGISRSKALALIDLAKKVEAKVIPNRAQCKNLSDDEIIERLVVVRGIGPWTAEMFLIFYLGRIDVFPATDYGVRKGYSILTKSRNLPRPKEFKEKSETWKPFRSIAAWYFWRVLD
ncbi:MAG: DNA-3-methyladenine glycosylase 2 family protein [Oligoflexia bacterium]|nr:DNA-3-methyladenine glycosylase 2 family protein [Oligoflexia bacterium]